MTAIPHYRPQSGPALLSAGFRPFFLLSALWSALAIPLWLISFAGEFPLPSVLPPLVWHVHEMVFGFGAATVAGILADCDPDWTGRQPLRGGPLASLALLWVAGRAGVFMSAWIGAGGWGIPRSRLSPHIPWPRRARDRRRAELAQPADRRRARLPVGRQSSRPFRSSRHHRNRRNRQPAWRCHVVDADQHCRWPHHPELYTKLARQRAPGNPAAGGFRPLRPRRTRRDCFRSHPLGSRAAGAPAPRGLPLPRDSQYRPSCTLARFGDFGEPLLWVLHLGYGWLRARLTAARAQRRCGVVAADCGASRADRRRHRHNDARGHDAGLARPYRAPARRRPGNDRDLRPGHLRCRAAPRRAAYRGALSPCLNPRRRGVEAAPSGCSCWCMCDR